MDEMSCIRLIALPLAIVWVFFRFALLLALGICKAAVTLPAVAFVIAPGYLFGLVVLLPRDLCHTIYTLLYTPRLGLDFKALVLIFLAPIVVVMWPAVLVLLAVGLIVEKGILMPVLGTLGTQDVFSLALWHLDTVTKPVYSAQGSVHGLLEFSHSLVSWMRAMRSPFYGVPLNIAFGRAMLAVLIGIATTATSVILVILIGAVKCIPFTVAAYWKHVDMVQRLPQARMVTLGLLWLICALVVAPVGVVVTWSMFLLACATYVGPVSGIESYFGRNFSDCWSIAFATMYERLYWVDANCRRSLCCEWLPLPRLVTRRRAQEAAWQRRWRAVRLNFGLVNDEVEEELGDERTRDTPVRRFWLHFRTHVRSGAQLLQEAGWIPLEDVQSAESYLFLGLPGYVILDIIVSAHGKGSLYSLLFRPPAVASDMHATSGDVPTLGNGHGSPAMLPAPAHCPSTNPASDTCTASPAAAAAAAAGDRVDAGPGPGPQAQAQPDVHDQRISDPGVSGVVPAAAAAAAAAGASGSAGLQALDILPHHAVLQEQEHVVINMPVANSSIAEAQSSAEPGAITAPAPERSFSDVSSSMGSGFTRHSPNEIELRSSLSDTDRAAATMAEHAAILAHRKVWAAAKANNISQSTAVDLLSALSEHVLARDKGYNGSADPRVLSTTYSELCISMQELRYITCHVGLVGHERLGELVPLQTHGSGALGQTHGSAGSDGAEPAASHADADVEAPACMPCTAEGSPPSPHEVMQSVCCNSLDQGTCINLKTSELAEPAGIQAYGATAALAPQQQAQVLMLSEARLSQLHAFSAAVQSIATALSRKPQCHASMRWLMDGADGDADAVADAAALTGAAAAASRVALSQAVDAPASEGGVGLPPSAAAAAAAASTNLPGPAAEAAASLTQGGPPASSERDPVQGSAVSPVVSAAASQAPSSTQHLPAEAYAAAVHAAEVRAADAFSAQEMWADPYEESACEDGADIADAGVGGGE